MLIKNLTPAPVDILSREGDIIGSFPPDLSEAREQEISDCTEIDGVPIVRPRPVTLPETEDETLLIVSPGTFAGREDRDDLLTPGEPCIEGGAVIGYYNLIGR